jgi:1D-myo-inositol 3-kinase
VPILVAGHYCHDTLIGNDSMHRTLGGSAAYVSAILQSLGETHAVIAKVGPDFLYASQVVHPPIVVAGRTTAFVDDYRGLERRGRVEAIAPAIEPLDLEGSWEMGVACAIAGELPLRTLRRLRRTCKTVLADAQTIVREIGPSGEVRLRPPAAEALELFDVLKASREEAAVLDLPALRRKMTLLITDGARGSTILRDDAEIHVPAQVAREKDPTGAGDSFLAGLAAGLRQGLPLEDAARVAAWCGARAVEHVGVPRLTAEEVRTCPTPPGTRSR